MSRETFLSPIAPSRPRRPAPPGACDTHVHIFGPFTRFPLAAQRSYSSPELPASAFLALLDAIGFERGVLVQPSAYGADNRAMLYGLAASPIRVRGVAVTGSGIPKDELAAMRELGVRGLRSTEIPDDRAFQGTVGIDEFEKLASTLRELALHAQLWTTCDWFVSAAPRLVNLGVPLVLDHMALIDTRAGVDAPGFQGLLRLPDDGHLVDIFDDWTGDDALRDRILVENPARLYGF